MIEREGIVMERGGASDGEGGASDMMERGGAPGGVK